MNAGIIFIANNTFCLEILMCNILVRMSYKFSSISMSLNCLLISEAELNQNLYKFWVWYTHFRKKILFIIRNWHTVSLALESENGKKFIKIIICSLFFCLGEIIFKQNEGFLSLLRFSFLGKERGKQTPHLHYISV